MSEVRKLASQTILYGFTYFAGRLLNFLLTPVYTRIFAPEHFGTISLIYAYITFFNILYTYGMETGFFYFANKHEGNKEVAGTSQASLVASTLLFSTILLAFSPWIADLIGYPGSTEYVVYAALILAFDTLAVIPFAWLRKADKALRFAVLKFLNIALNILFNFFFLIACPYILKHSEYSFLHPMISAVYEPGQGVRYVFLSNVLSSLLSLLFLLPQILKIRLSWNQHIWRSMLRYSWPLLILGFAGMINETLDRILLKERLPLPNAEALEQVGIYSACYKLSIFMTLAIASFRYAAEPFFFARMKDVNSKELFARILKYFSFVTSFIFLGIMLYLPLVIHIIGKSYRSGLEVVPILLMANLFLGIFYYLSQWYKQTNKTLYGAMVAVGGALITLIINFVFIPQYGYMASAWATFFSYLFMAVVSYLLGQKYYPVKYPLGRIAFYILSAAGLFFMSYLANGRHIGEMSLAIYMLNTVLILAYLFAFLYLERPAILLSKLKRKSV